MSKGAPFQPGDTVKCRDVGVRTALQLGAEYIVASCAEIGRVWMVQVVGPAGFDLAGAKLWFQARRFVRKVAPLVS